MSHRALKTELLSLVERMDDENIERVVKFCQTNANQIILADRLGWKYVNENAYDFITKKNKKIELKTISSIQNKSSLWFSNTKNKTDIMLIHCLPESIDNDEHFFLLDKSKLTEEEFSYIDDGYSEKGKGYIPHGIYSSTHDTPKKRFWIEHETTLEKLKKL